MDSHQNLVLQLDKPLKKAVIVGAGPSGLCLGIRLRQIGVEDIEFVDPRIDAYTRSGDYNPPVFEELSRLLNLEIEHSPSYHIKDIERFLYQHAVSIGIKFRKEKFISLGNNSVVAGEAKPTDIPCDVVFDCSGTARVVINNVNSLVNPKPFPVLPIAKMHHSTYALIRIKSKVDLISLLNNSFPIDASYFLALREFQSMGWKYNSIPHSYGKLQNKGKTNIYCEVPAELKDEASLLQWINALVTFKCGKLAPPVELVHSSRKHKNKPAASSFEVNQQYLERSYYRYPQLPLIFHVGDASVNVSFNLGRSLIFGAQRIQVLIANLKVVDGQIHEINLSQYQKEYQLVVSQQLEVAKNNEEWVKNRFMLAKTRLLTAYKEAINSLDQITDKKIGIAPYALERLDRAVLLVQNLDLLGEPSENYLEFAVRIAKTCKKFAKQFSDVRQFLMAEKYYRNALNIYETYFSDNRNNEKIAIYLELIILLHYVQDHQAATKLANEAIQKILPAVKKDKDKFEAKIFYYKVKSQFIDVEKKLRCGDIAKSDLIQVYIDIENSLHILQINNFAKGACVPELQSQLTRLKQNYGSKGIVIDPQLVMPYIRPGVGLKYF